MKKIDVEVEQVRQNGLTNVTIPLSALFTNCTCISNNIKEPASTLEEVIIIISLDKPLLSDRQRELLNPMVLTVGSASEMPDNTMSFCELKNKYSISYKVFFCSNLKTCLIRPNVYTFRKPTRQTSCKSLAILALVHVNLRNEVGALSLTNCTMGFELATFSYGKQCLNSSSTSVAHI